MEITCRVYRPRDPRKTALYGLLDSLYDRVKGAWEERFERSYGFWRGLVDEVVASYLACGLWQGGFARVLCRSCPEEFLVAFSCCPQMETMENSLPDLPCLQNPPRNSLQIVSYRRARP